MALYEYSCEHCGNVFEKRMPMADVVQLIDCPACGKKAKKVLGNFALVGIAESSFGDGPAPWEDDGGMGGMPDMGGMGMPGMDDHGHDHGHSHDFDFGDDDF